MEAHSGISAKIVEESGFKGIWGSGLGISASLGVRDNNEASWTQVLEVVEFMSDATSIPILLDGDTGYGNFNNMRRLVRKLEQRGVAGVCIEDKVFPKTNSFLRDGTQPLAEINEFCGKIKAGKESQRDDDFIIVARLEAFISGLGLAEALKRAEAYRKAGADAILVHSKMSTPEEVFSFVNEWSDRLPIVIVPTKYYSTPTQAFRDKGISVVIWANHLIRGSVLKMQEIASKIHHDQNLLVVEDHIVPVKELFRLQGDEELQVAEKRYLATKHDAYCALILAATRGNISQEITETIPKTLIKVGNKSILEKIVLNLRAYDVNKISVVAGYKKETIQLPDIHIIENEDYATTSQMVSLAIGMERQHGNLLVIFGDILFKKYMLQFIMDDPGDVVLLVDSNLARRKKRNTCSDYVFANKPDDISSLSKDIYLEKIVFSNVNQNFSGEWIGIMKLSAKGTHLVKSFIQKQSQETSFKKMDIRDMLNQFVTEGIKVRIHYISGHWIDVDNLVDLQLAGVFCDIQE